jgi:hypothetical protein
MLTAVVVASIWAVALMVVAAAGGWFAFGAYERWIALQERRQSSLELDQHHALLERQAAIELDAAIVPERAELQKAELALKAAQARADAHVAEHPDVLAAQVVKELKIIEAEAEGEALAALEQPDNEDDADILRELLVGYDAYCERGHDVTFPGWFGNTNLIRLNVSAVRVLVTGYIAHLNRRTQIDFTFEEWLGNFDPEQIL